MTVAEQPVPQVGRPRVRWIAPGGGSTQPLVMFLGNVRRGEYESLHARGFRVGVLRDVSAVGTVRVADLDLVAKHDFSRPTENLVRVIGALSEAFPLAGILNMREDYVEDHARLGRRLGFEAPAPEVTELVLSKPAMRAAFLKGIGERASARFAEIRSAADVQAFGARCGYPLILKPSRLYSSLFVVKITRRQDVGRTFSGVSGAVRRYAYARGLPENQCGLQVEEFLEGSNHSVDCFVDRDGEVVTTPVVDVLTGQDIGVPDFHHFARLLPSRLPHDAQAQIDGLAKHAVGAVGLRSAVAHVEFILTADGPRLLELAARPGGNRSRLLAAAFGLDLVSSYLALSRGRPTTPRARFARPFAIVTPFPRSQGIYAGLRAEGRITSLPTYRWHDVSVEPGTRVGTVADGQKAFVSVELAGDRMSEVERDVRRIAKMPDLIALATESETRHVA
jgi:hypothetical protein